MIYLSKLTGLVDKIATKIETKVETYKQRQCKTVLGDIIQIIIFNEAVRLSVSAIIGVSYFLIINLLISADIITDEYGYVSEAYFIVGAILFLPAIYIIVKLFIYCYIVNFIKWLRKK